MRFKWDKKYLYWGITAFLVICSCIFFYYILFHGVRFKAGFNQVISILSPIIYGFVIAYLLSPIVNILEKKVLFPIFKRNKPISPDSKLVKRIRILSILLTYFIVILLIYALFAMLIPQLTRSVQSIVFQSGTYVKNITEWLTDLSDRFPFLKDFIEVENFEFDSESIVSWLNNNLDIEKYLGNIGTFFTKFYTGIYDVVMVLFNFIIGTIISVYLLSSKEMYAGQGKKIVYALLERRRANRFIKNMRFVHRTFTGFINGKIVDSVIIGILCFIGTSLLGIPYPSIISVIVGVTNVIPFFGPYLGAIPSALFILVISPIHCLYFIIFIVILQQLDGNVIGPKILGGSTGLSSFWVIFAITLFGGFLGIFGMIIGVPVFAVLFAMFKSFFNRSLKKKGLPTDTANYVNLKEIEDNILVHSTSSDDNFNKDNSSEKNTWFKKLKEKFNANKQKGKTQNQENSGINNPDEIKDNDDK